MAGTRPAMTASVELPMATTDPTKSNGRTRAGKGGKAALHTLRQALLAPRSVAIVGQSNDAAKTAGRPLNYLRRAGYPGRIFAVNARRDEVLGERAFPSLSALPEVPEHIYIVAPTEA